METTELAKFGWICSGFAIGMFFSFILMEIKIKIDTAKFMKAYAEYQKEVK